jgi:hypothetical protein
MAFRISALPAEAFHPWFELDDEALRARGARAYTADVRPGCGIGKSEIS